MTRKWRLHQAGEPPGEPRLRRSLALPKKKRQRGSHTLHRGRACYGEGEEEWREGARGREAGRGNLGRWFRSPPLSLGFALPSWSLPWTVLQITSTPRFRRTIVPPPTRQAPCSSRPPPG